MLNKNILKHPYYIGFIAFIILGILLLLLYTIIRYEKNIEDDIFKVATSDVLQITQHKALYVKDILDDSDNYIVDIKSNDKLRVRLEKNIHNLMTDNIKYAYILYKDKNDVFRFLVDASPENEKSMLNQKFDVTSQEWFNLYTDKEPIMIKHSVLQKLSISYLVPILNNEKVELVLVIDFSINKVKEIDHIIVMMKTGIVLVILVILIALAVLIFQLFRYR